MPHARYAIESHEIIKDTRRNWDWGRRGRTREKERGKKLFINYIKHDNNTGKSLAHTMQRNHFHETS